VRTVLPILLAVMRSVVRPDGLLRCCDTLFDRGMSRLLILVLNQASVATPPSVQPALNPEDGNTVVNPVAVKLFDVN
jgi:hypothetical protein